MSLRSPLRRLQDLVAGPPVEVGDISAIADGVRVVTLLSGGVVHARGESSVGERVFVRGDVIEGPAPTFTVEFAEV